MVTCSKGCLLPVLLDAKQQLVLLNVVLFSIWQGNHGSGSGRYYVTSLSLISIHLS